VRRCITYPDCKCKRAGLRVGGWVTGCRADYLAALNALYFKHNLLFGCSLLRGRDKGLPACAAP